MFLLDDVLLGPGKAAYAIFQELAKKAQEEWLNDDGVKQELQQLYAMLEAGRISDTEFDAKEGSLLERLEQIARLKFPDRAADEPASDGAVASGGPAAVAAIDVTPRAALPAVPPAVPAAPEMVAPQPQATFRAPLPVAVPTSPPPAIAPVRPAAIPAPEPVGIVSAPAYAPTSGPLSINQVIERAVGALSILKFRVSSITSVAPAEDGWRVTLELVERRGLPDTNDLLGMYELRLDTAGNVLRYERTQVRRRCDLNR